MPRLVRHVIVTALAIAALSGCVAEDVAPETTGEEEAVASTEQELGTTNALISNALISNALISNALISNALISNALISNALISNALATDSKSRLWLQYAYGCAMPAGQTETVRIPTGYKTYIDLPLAGALGLAPEWATGACDTDCQRWVSACLIARTNHAGKRVLLSVRKSDNYNNNGYADAMNSVSSLEAGAFDRPEGAYFGNVFAKDAAGNPAPRLYGCAAGNYLPAGFLINDLSSRFCGPESENAACLLTRLFDHCSVPDTTYRYDSGACKYRDTNGAWYGCYSGGVVECDPLTNASCSQLTRTLIGSGTRYDQVITVYREDRCPHADFVTGAAMPASCSPCAAEVAAIDPYCAQNSWDATCVAEAKDLCGAHSVEVVGSKLAADASACTAAVCLEKSYCCTSYWYQSCVDAVDTSCR